MTKKRDDSYFAAGRRKNKKYFMIIIPVIIVVAAAGAVGALLYQPPPVAAAISGVECNRNEQFNYHVHSHLDVFVNGEKRVVPANIGIIDSPRCFYWLHSHSGDGIIHIEAPQQMEFILGQFLDVWSQTRDSLGFFDSVSGMNVTVYVDGEEYEGNHRTVSLESLQQITLVYGSPPANIPDEFDFSSADITS